MIKYFDNFRDFIDAVIGVLWQGPTVKIADHSAIYDASRHFMRVIAATSSGDVFCAEYRPTCERDLPGMTPAEFAALIEFHV
ncbi:MAG: hypothetical protein NVV73_07055 [Cellvibrionaceae bacterium]|nr:hypothetical protein [Cellvibrionaceae bacterium]